MKHIFVYGTLLNDEILEHLLNFVPEKINATLFDFKRVQVKGAAYPAILPHIDSSVSGMLLCGLNKKHLTTLDNYETSHYQRQPVELILSDGKHIHSQTYVYKPKYYDHLSNEPWSNDHYRSKYLHP